MVEVGRGMFWVFLFLLISNGFFGLVRSERKEGPGILPVTIETAQTESSKGPAGQQGQEGGIDCYSHPFQVIYPNEDHTEVRVHSENVQKVSACTRGPISILAVVGPYHSGKSFLLNILAQDRQAFKVGASTSPQTMGLWMLPTRFRSSIDGSQIILLDTEGFFGTDVAESYDATTFAISTLLSSHIVYNSIKLIDQAAVEYLELLSRRTQLFNLRTQLRNASEIPVRVEDFPSLTWVVEDFVQDLGGRSPTEWLEDFLDAKRDSAQLSGMHQIFPSIDCETLFLPATSLAELRDLSAVPFDRLTPEFKQGVDSLRQRLFSLVKAKKTGSELMTGAQMTSLLRFLAESANTQSFPRIPSLWQSWLSNLTIHAKTDASSLHDQLIEQRIAHAPLPLTTANFRAIADHIEDEVLEYYQKLVFGLQHLFQDPINLSQLKTSMARVRSFAEQSNNQRLANYIKNAATVSLETFQGQVASLPLPQPRKQLEAECNHLKDEAVFRYTDQLKSYHEAGYYSEHLKSLKNDLEHTCVAHYLKNRDKVELTLRNFAEDVENSYHRLFKEFYGRDHQTTVALRKSQMLALDKSVQQQCFSSFQEKLVRSQLTWLTEELEYRGHIDKLKETFARSFAQLDTENQQRVQDATHGDFIKMFSQFEQTKIEPFPDTPSRLKSKIEQEGRKVLERFLQVVDAYEYTAISNDYATQGTKRIAAFTAKIAEENRREFDELFGIKTKQCTLEKRRKWREDCLGVCWSDFIPGYQFSLFRTDTLDCLQAVSKARSTHIPPGVIEELLPQWYADLGLDQNASSVIFIVFFTSALGFAIWYGISMNKSPAARSRK